MGKYRYRRNTAALFLAVLLTVSRTESFPLLQSKKATRIPPGSNSNSNASSATFFRRRQGARGTVCLANDDNNDNLAASSQRNLIFKAYTRYLSLCELQPVVTKSLTAGLLAVVGDAVSQSLFLPSAPAKFDWIRCRTFFFVAVLFEGPWIHHWYNGLWKLGRWVQAVAAHGPADTTTRNIIVNQQQRVAVLAQVVVDQTVGVALFFPAYFVVYECVHAVVSGRVPDLAKAFRQCRLEVVAVWWTQYKVWPVVNYINFSYVPEPLRNAVSNVVAVFWNVYLTAAVAGSST